MDTKLAGNVYYVQFSRVKDGVRVRNQLMCPSGAPRNRITVYENVVMLNKAASEGEGEKNGKDDFTVDFYPLDLWPRL